jgi:hypothetical protein
MEALAMSKKERRRLELFSRVREAGTVQDVFRADHRGVPGDDTGTRPDGRRVEDATGTIGQSLAGLPGRLCCGQLDSGSRTLRDRTDTGQERAKTSSAHTGRNETGETGVLIKMNKSFAMKSPYSTIADHSLYEGGNRSTSASGELIFNLFFSLAQLKRRLIQERTKAGLAAARARGRNGGRPKVTAKEARVVLAKKLHADKSLDIDDICKTLRISRSTFYRYVQL